MDASGRALYEDKNNKGILSVDYEQETIATTASVLETLKYDGEGGIPLYKLKDYKKVYQIIKINN